jgi:hypothetical protein
LLLHPAAPKAAAMNRNGSAGRDMGTLDLRDSTGFWSSKAGATDDDRAREWLEFQ